MDGAFTLAVNTTGATTFAGVVGPTVVSVTTNVGGTTSIGANVTTTGAQTFNDAVSLTAATALTSSGGAAISLNSTVNGAFTLAVNTTGATTFAGVVGPTVVSVTTNVGGTTSIGANVTTTGAQTFNDAVSLTASVTLTASTVTFFSLAGAGNSLTLTCSAAVTVDGAIYLGILNLLSNGVGTTNLTGVISTNGTQTYSNAVSLTGNTTLTSTGNLAISLSSTVNGAFTLAVNTTGATTFAGVVGPTVVSVTTNIGGTTSIGANVTTTGAQTFNDAVSLTAATALTSSGGAAISLNSTVNGAFTLAVNTTGATTFAGVVGPTVVSVTTNVGGTTSIGANVTTTGAQTFNDAVSLTASVTLTASTVTFFSLAGAGNSLTLTCSAAVTVDGAIYLGILNLLSNGVGTTNLTGVISTNGTQTYSNAVSLTGNTTLTSTGNLAISLSSTVNGAFTLAVNTTGATTFAGVVGPTVVSVTTNVGGTTSIGANVTTTGAQTFNDAVSLTAATALTSSGGAAISLNSTVNGAFTLAVNTTGATTFGAAVGGGAALASLTTNAGGTTTLTGNVTTTGNQIFGDPLLVATNTIVGSGAGSITLLDIASINEGFSFTLGSGGATTIGTQAIQGNGVGVSEVLTFNTTLTATVAGTLSNGIDVSIAAGTVDVGGNDFTIETLSNSGTLSLTGTQVTQSIAVPDINSGTVTYYGAAGGTIRIDTFYILDVDGLGGTFTLNQDISVGNPLGGGQVLLSAGVLDASAASRRITLYGDWRDAIGTGTFIPRLGTVEFKKPSGIIQIRGDNNWYIFQCIRGGAGDITIEFQDLKTQTIVSVAGSRFRIKGDPPDPTGIPDPGPWPNSIKLYSIGHADGVFWRLSAQTSDALTGIIQVRGNNNWYVFECVRGGVGGRDLTIEFEDLMTQTIVPVAGSRFRILGDPPDPTGILDPGPWPNSIKLYSINQSDGSFWNFTAQSSDSLSEFEYVVLNWSQATPYSITVPQFVLTRFALQCPGLAARPARPGHAHRGHGQQREDRPPLRQHRRNPAGI